MCGCKHCAAGWPHETITASDRKMIAIFNRRYPAHTPARRLKSYDAPPAKANKPSNGSNTRQPWEPRPARAVVAA
jgi:hypothetical protein